MNNTYGIDLGKYEAVLLNYECFTGIEIEHIQYQINLGIFKIKNAYVFENIIKLELMQ